MTYNYSTYKSKLRALLSSTIPKCEPYINPFLAEYNGNYITIPSPTHKPKCNPRKAAFSVSEEDCWRKIAWGPMLIKKSAYTSRYLHYTTLKKQQLQVESPHKNQVRRLSNCPMTYKANSKSVPSSLLLKFRNTIINSKTKTLTSVFNKHRGRVFPTKEIIHIDANNLI